MSFLAPGAFFLGLLLPVIIALYLLKLRRIEREVPSTFLWRKMVRDVEANAPWQKLRPNQLMILQLLFLAALILALTRPFTWVEGSGGQAAIIILDTSASMSAVDVAPSRIESAKERARQLVDELPDAARVTVIEAGREARVLVSSSLDRRQAHLAIEKVQPGTGGSDMTVALELASAIAARQPGTEIIVLSDGRVSLPDRLGLKGALRYIPFGLSGENQSISLLTLERGGSGLTAFTQVSNYGQKAASRRLLLFADGLQVNAVDLVDIPPGGQKNVITEGLPEGTQQIEARLSRDGVSTTPDDAQQDVLSMDDSAHAVAPVTQKISVNLVTQGNLFIETALSLLPGVELTEQDLGAPANAASATPQANAPTPTLAPTATPAANAPTGPAGLTIYDNDVPNLLPATGSLLFIAPPRSLDGYFTTTGLVENPSLRALDATDPLLVNVSLAQVSLLDAVKIPLPDWATPVVAGDLQGENVPLIFRGEVQGRRVAVIAFDLRHSDLPLQVAFPVLWSNLVDWLVPGGRSAVPAQVAPGSSLFFTAPVDSDNTGGPVTVTRPDGVSVQLQPEDGHYVFVDTGQLGIYQVRFPSSQNGSAQSIMAINAAFAVNLFAPQESALKPADNLPGLEAGQSQAAGVGNKSQREWWHPLALLALGLLVGEWLVYQRAGLVRLKDWLLRVLRLSPLINRRPPPRSLQR